MTQVLELPIDKVKPNPSNPESRLANVETLAESIKRRGQLVPIIVRPHPGTKTDLYLVVAGHRRLAAAQQLKLKTIQAVVKDTGDVGEVLDSLAENTARVELSAAELTDQVGRLEGFEMSDEEIAAALDLEVADVTDAKAIRSKPKRQQEAAFRHQLSLEHAAAVAEFADDPDDLKQIERILERDPARLDHLLASLREDREVRTKRATVAEHLASKGIPVVEWDDHLKADELAHLKTGATKCTPANHRGCPGNAATFLYGDDVRPTFVCTDWRKHGHTHDWYRDSKDAKKQPSAKEREKATAERRAVIANNKAWKVATTVRRKWIVEHLFSSTRLDHIAGAEAYLVDELLAHPRDISSGFGESGKTDAELGLSKLAPPKDGDPLDRRKVRLLALLIAFRERQLDVWTWKTAVYDPPVRQRYFTFLRSAGYALSDVEELAAKGRQK